MSASLACSPALSPANYQFRRRVRRSKRVCSPTGMIAVLPSLDAVRHVMTYMVYTDGACHAGTIIVASSSNALHKFLSTFLDTMAQPGLTRPHRYPYSCHIPRQCPAGIPAHLRHPRHTYRPWRRHSHHAGYIHQSCCCSSFHCSPAHSLGKTNVNVDCARCIHVWA